MTTLPTAGLDGAALVALRRGPHREAVTRELWTRAQKHGAACDSPGALATALGCNERTVRRLLDEADAAKVVIAVGWERKRGGGAVKGRATVEANRAKAAAQKAPRKNRRTK